MAKNRVRAFRASVRGLIESAILPVYVLDPQRRISYANAALLNWLGCDAASVTNKPCDYHSIVDRRQPAPFLHGLAPPPLIAGRQISQATVFCQRGDEQREYRRASFCSLQEAEPSPLLVIVEGVSRPLQECYHDWGEDQPERLHLELSRFRLDMQADYGRRCLVGTSAVARRVRQQVDIAIQSGCAVVIVGPPGSGREHIARTIHCAGNSTTTGPLVPLACALLDVELVRSTRESIPWRAAHLPAQQEVALLLLDLDELGLAAQGQLVDWLARGEGQLRTLATARHSITQLVDRGQLMEELAHILGTLEIVLPPLSQRRPDIPLLAQAALERCNARSKIQRAGFTTQAMDRLVAYTWHQNVDQLFQVVERAAAVAETPMIDVRDLPRDLELAEKAAEVGRADPPEPIVLDLYLQEVERQLIRETLQQTNGNKSLAARQLGVSRARLIRRVVQLGLEPNR